MISPTQPIIPAKETVAAEIKVAIARCLAAKETPPFSEPTRSYLGQAVTYIQECSCVHPGEASRLSDDAEELRRMLR
jgi:hypothetical protein